MADRADHAILKSAGAFPYRFFLLACPCRRMQHTRGDRPLHAAPCEPSMEQHEPDTTRHAGEQGSSDRRPATRLAVVISTIQRSHTGHRVMMHQRAITGTGLFLLDSKCGRRKRGRERGEVAVTGTHARVASHIPSRALGISDFRRRVLDPARRLPPLCIPVVPSLNEAAVHTAHAGSRDLWLTGHKHACMICTTRVPV